MKITQQQNKNIKYSNAESIGHRLLHNAIWAMLLSWPRAILRDDSLIPAATDVGFDPTCG